MFGEWKPALLLLVVLTVLTGAAYPLSILIVARVFFPWQAGGSLLTENGRVAGSALVGQPFDRAGYFWGRPSATVPVSYNSASSMGSNLGPTHPALADALRSRIEVLRKADPDNRRAVPVDLVTASASGLDPHISPAAAEHQLGRVARARRTDEKTLRALVVKHTSGRTVGLLGERRVNVLELNLAIDRMAKQHE